jgi:hypothetical protein
MSCGRRWWRLSDVRQVNRRIARRLGYPAPPDELEMPDVTGWRERDEVVDRALALDVVVSCAHGFEIGPAWTWLKANDLIDAVTHGETEYLDELESGIHLDDLARRLQVEALWALLWALSYVDDLDFGAGCGGGVAPLLPEFDDVAGARAFRSDAVVRDSDELLAALDLARCLTAGLGDGDVSIGFAPGEVEPYVVWERRRALEWLAGADWDTDPAPPNVGSIPGS